MENIALRKSFFPESNFFSGWELDKTFDDKYITVKEELAAGSSFWKKLRRIIFIMLCEMRKNPVKTGNFDEKTDKISIILAQRR